MAGLLPTRYACCTKHLEDGMKAMTSDFTEEGLVIVRPLALSPDALMKCHCKEPADWFLRRVETERDRELAEHYIAKDRKIVVGESNSVVPKHDYEAGEYYSKMHTDPLCKICSLPKRDSLHN